MNYSKSPDELISTAISAGKRQRGVVSRTAVHMRSSIDRLTGLAHLDSNSLTEEISFLENALDQLLHTSRISNDAYLAAGAVQGGLSMLGDMIDIGISRSEVQEQLRQLLERAGRVDESHPGLDEAIEERRV